PLHPILIDRIQTTIKALLSERKNHLSTQATIPAARNQELSLQEDRQSKLFSEFIYVDSEHRNAADAWNLVE
ncbi:ATP-dependent DNA helicase IV, partial [Enterococcus lactis]|nr:ATP-dependent DNA helicase IV [Enterococcus lactis]